MHWIYNVVLAHEFRQYFIWFLRGRLIIASSSRSIKQIGRKVQCLFCVRKLNVSCAVWDSTRKVVTDLERIFSLNCGDQHCRSMFLTESANNMNTQLISTEAPTCKSQLLIFFSFICISSRHCICLETGLLLCVDYRLRCSQRQSFDS